MEKDPAIYSGHFTAGEFNNNNILIDELKSIFTEAGNDVVTALPSIHRVQRVFGDTEELSMDRLILNTAYDLQSFVGYQGNATLTAASAIRALQIAEIALLEQYVDQSPIKAKDPRFIEEDINVRTNIVIRTVWREWKPEVENHEMGLVDSLLKQVLGNLQYTDLTMVREARERNALLVPFSEEDDGLLPTDIMLARHGQDNSFSPSAEVEFFRRESVRELEQVSEGMILAEWLNGTSVEELAFTHNLTLKAIRRQLQSDLLLACQLGVERFGWGDQHINTIMRHMNNFIKSKLDNTVPSEGDMWDMFANAHINLAELMGMIDHLPLLEKKCVLYFLTYLGTDYSNVENWSRANNISSNLYKISVNRAFRFIRTALSTPQISDKSIKDIVKEADSYRVAKSSAGKRLNEDTNRMNRLLTIAAQDHFRPGSLSERERKIVEAIQDHYVTKGTVPTEKELSELVGIKSSTVIGLMMVLLRYDYKRRRYATKEFQIRTGSAWYRVISWFEQHKETEMMLQTLLLNPLNSEIFRLSTTPNGTYYRSPKEIFDIIKRRYKIKFDSNHLFSIYSNIIKTLDKDINVRDLQNWLSQKSVRSPQKTADRIKSAILQRINQRLSLGAGMYKEIAEKLGINPETVAQVYRSAVKSIKLLADV